MLRIFGGLRGRKGSWMSYDASGLRFVLLGESFYLGNGQTLVEEIFVNGVGLYGC